jgi:hypothetical protein
MPKKNPAQDARERDATGKSQAKGFFKGGKDFHRF